MEVNKHTSSVEETSSKRLKIDEKESLDPFSSTVLNEYAGFCVPCDNFEIERVPIHTLDAQSFFAHYVAKRKPVVLQGFIQDVQFKAASKWTNEYLAKKVGEANLKVEKRESIHATFGQGIEVPMTFTAFLELVSKGDYFHYLTTQDVEADEEGRPDVMAPFMHHLAKDFPLRPTLMGNLIPQNINLWMGNNRAGSSSGLHHDYHDNLYLLLRGKKRFRLYSPQDTEKMYTRGQLVKVHPNGRINYEGEVTTAYGADPFSEAALLASIEKEKAEKELELAEKAVINGGKNAQKRLEQAEKRLEKAMDAMLSLDREEEEIDEVDGFHFEEEELDDDEEEEEEEHEVEEDDENTKKVDKTVKNPLNFSLVDQCLLQADTSKEKKNVLLKEKYPKFAHAKAAFCEINVGEMLYLPASWFHEVQSFGTDVNNTNKYPAAKEQGHLALNYWFHPPDQLDQFEKPYTSSFWQKDWEQRKLEK